NHILPGTILAEDVGKAIDNGKGKAVLATMGGGTLTATKEGDKIVLTDAAGTRATVTKADEQHSNGVVHHIDTVLVPRATGQTEG
ncbi:MAG TPA: fasciclin domain-containing protein, partial [Sphingomicrobium sp.]